MMMALGARACGRDGALHPAEQDSAGCKILEINLIDFCEMPYKLVDGRDGLVRNKPKVRKQKKGTNIMYSVRPCSENPMLILFTLDGSGSMSKTMPASGMKKCDVLATVVNKTLRELCIASAREKVKHYFDIAVLRYSEDKVDNAFAGIPALEEKMVNSIVDIEANPLRVEIRKKKRFAPTGDVFEEEVPFPVWIEPHANGGTPMCAALQSANEIIATWVASHPAAHPPIVINVTDGVATDGTDKDLEGLASIIKALSTSDGATLLMNLHISSGNGAMPINYASSEDGIANPKARLLWRMSSEIPGEILPAVNLALGDTAVQSSSRFVTFNGTEVDIAKFIEVGTRATVPALTYNPEM